MESRWERVSIPEGEAERLFTKSRTFAGDVWFRFRRKPTALAGLILVAFMLVFALIGPILSPYSYSGQDT
ncbi:MAG: ABC transporter permease, partial [Clostridiales bacterium]|nr:ABC transporter permease [Clostridiales bacterium]